MNIRRGHHLFPLRPYLPQLVEALEDTDGNVRECAKVSVVELFTGPAVTDAARADLKKEMTKKNVRKTIVDSVLTKVLAGGGGSGGLSTPGTNSEAGSENGDGYIPPSLMLMKQKQTTGGTPTLPRAVSGTVKEIRRTASRSALAAPPSPPADGPSAAGESNNSDVRPVYVSLSHLLG